MYQIGKFAEICNTTIKTLRYYDDINLLKPIKVNNYTGYRYYCEDQITIMKKINKLKEANFSLEEISKIIKSNNTILISNKIDELQKTYNEQEKILYEFEKNMSKGKVKLIKNPNYIIVGIEKKLKERKDITKKIKKIDKVLYKDLFEENTLVIENYEDSYKEDNVKCFIGRKLKEIYKNKPGIISKLNNTLTVTDNNMIKTMLYTKDKKENIKEAYKNIINYALKENIQIRGNYQEIYTNNDVEIYIEAYDLKVENPDAIKYINSLKSKLKNIQPEEYIGTWELQYEDNLPNTYKNRIKNNIEYSIPKTKYNKFIINKDGTTNFDNILLKEHYLEVTEDNTTYYHILKTPYTKNKNTYMNVLINFKESNSRPYNYIYKRKED